MKCTSMISVWRLKLSRNADTANGCTRNGSCADCWGSNLGYGKCHVCAGFLCCIVQNVWYSFVLLSGCPLVWSNSFCAAVTCSLHDKLFIDARRIQTSSCCARREWLVLYPWIPACLHIPATALESLFNPIGTQENQQVSDGFTKALSGRSSGQSEVYYLKIRTKHQLRFSIWL